MQKEMLERRAHEFLNTQKTLLVATSDENGTPTASYAPFVLHNGDFYIYISAMSRHTKDLKKSSVASVLLIEDEVGANNLFARIRITFPCKAVAIPRKDDRWRKVIDLFGKKFGPVFDLIRPLEDFILFRLKPSEATYVEGFGRAYRMTRDLRNPIHLSGNKRGPKKSEIKEGKKTYKIMRGDGRIVESAEKGRYAGWNGKQTKRLIFGRLDCKTGMRMKKENRVFFDNWDDAIMAGFRPCKRCKPMPNDTYKQ